MSRVDPRVFTALAPGTGVVVGVGFHSTKAICTGELRSQYVSAYQRSHYWLAVSSTGAGGATRISARLKCVQEHSFPISVSVRQFRFISVFLDVNRRCEVLDRHAVTHEPLPECPFLACKP